MYQGHSNDGSSIQKHSVGDIYPYVIQIREIANNAGGWDRTYELLHTNGSVTSHATHDEAWDTASEAIIARRREALAQQAAAQIAPFAPLIRSGVTSTKEVSDLIRAVEGRRHGLPVDRADQIRFDFLSGLARLAKANQRSHHGELALA
jgi:hypothetical protein